MRVKVLSQESAVICPGSSDPENLCNCAPPNFILRHSYTCIYPPAERCGLHKVQGILYCVSCITFAHPISGYKPIEDAPVSESTPSPHYTSSRSPSRERQNLDLCSEVLSAKRLVCMRDGGQNMTNRFNCVID